MEWSASWISPFSAHSGSGVGVVTGGSNFRFHLGNSLRGCEPTIEGQAGRPKKWVLGKRDPQGKSRVGHDLCVGRGGLYMRCLWSSSYECGDALKTLPASMCFFEGLCRAQRRESHVISTGGSSAGH